MGVRAGQGYGVPKPKRLRCPDCDKRGVGLPKLLSAPGVYPMWVRTCQYCGGSWSDLSWKIAKAEAAKREGAAGVEGRDAG